MSLMDWKGKGSYYNSPQGEGPMPQFALPPHDGKMTSPPKREKGDRMPRYFLSLGQGYVTHVCGSQSSNTLNAQ